MVWVREKGVPDLLTIGGTNVTKLLLFDAYVAMPVILEPLHHFIRAVVLTRLGAMTR